MWILTGVSRLAAKANKRQVHVLPTVYLNTRAGTVRMRALHSAFLLLVQKGRGMRRDRYREVTITLVPHVTHLGLTINIPTVLARFGQKALGPRCSTCTRFVISRNHRKTVLISNRKWPEVTLVVVLHAPIVALEQQRQFDRVAPH